MPAADARDPRGRSRRDLLDVIQPFPTFSEAVFWALRELAAVTRRQALTLAAVTDLASGARALARRIFHRAGRLRHRRARPDARRGRDPDRVEAELMAIERIAVATDRSQTATRAVAWAAEMARNYGAELIVIQVFVPGPPPPGAETDLAVHAEEMGGPGTQGTRRRRRRPVGRDRRRRRGGEGRRPRRRQPRDERPPRVPARKRPEPRLAQRALYGRDREHHRRAEEEAPVEPHVRDEAETSPSSPAAT